MRGLVSLALAFTLACVAPVAAEEIITPLGDRWYSVRNHDPVVIPESGVIGPVIICLDEVPGGLDSPPSIRVKPVEKHVGQKRTVMVTREGFSPLATAEQMAYASVVLRGEPGSAYIVSVIIRGKE